MSSPELQVQSLAKAQTGIIGFDEITMGGLPRGRTTVVEGGPGSGKTIFALQTLINGGRHFKEPGVFVAFEESSSRIIVNAGRFGWDIPSLEKDALFFLDAQPSADLIQSGTFDIGGMLAALDSKIAVMGAKRIVFDSLDVVLLLLEDARAVQREVYRLHEWLLERELTAIITTKADPDPSGLGRRQTDFMPFMVDCSMVLRHEFVQGVSQRGLRIMKYRGSSFDENESPLVITSEGMEVAFTQAQDQRAAPVTTERLTSGVERLDTMLGGGYFRGASILITGAPGTSKTTLSGAFVEAACQRGEAALFISFDSRADEIVRNLASVQIDLQSHVDSDRLVMMSARAITASAEIYLMRIKRIAREHKITCLVIDPISALAKAGNVGTSNSVVDRLVDWAKYAGITIVCTSLLERAGEQMEATSLQISTIADTWIHLNNIAVGGERNRGLSIIKSRGTEHSNQVRELVLSSSGITLEDVYTAGGEVLMGAMRYEKEQQVARLSTQREFEIRRKQIELDGETAEIRAKLRALQQELQLREVQKLELERAASEHEEECAVSSQGLRAIRHGDLNPSQSRQER